MEQAKNIEIDVSENYKVFLKILIDMSAYPLYNAFCISGGNKLLTRASLILANRYQASKVNQDIHSFQDIQCILESLIYLRQTYIESFQEFESLVNSFIDAFDKGINRAANPKEESLLSNLESFLKYLKEDFFPPIKEDCLESYRTAPTEDYECLSTYDVNSKFQNIEGKILRLREKSNPMTEDEEYRIWREYLKVNNKPKLTGGYGRQEKLILGSKIYEFTDIEAAFKELSTTQKGKDLKARFKAYADMYKQATYNYHDEYIEANANNKTNIKKKVSKSISSNAEFNKYIPILLKELENK